MLDTLARIYDDAGRLRGVTYILFEGDPHFITSVALRFESLTAHFRAVPEDDTLAASLGELALPEDDVPEEVSAKQPWAGCLGCGVCWAWRLTNQQGYTDGVRLEFSEPGGPSLAIVEFIVIASSISVFVASEVARG